MNDANKRYDMKKLGEVAAGLNELHGKSVGLRISLQGPLDIAKKIATSSLPAHGGKYKKNLKKVRRDLTEVMAHLLKVLETGENSDNYDDAHMHKELDREAKLAHTWSRISSEMANQKPHWEEVICKWQRRLRLQHSKAKSFNRSLWDQFNDIHSSGNYDTRKHSQRVDAVTGDEGVVENITTHDQDAPVDENEYEDRNFYYMLLKSFVSNENNGGQMGSPNLWGKDLQELQKSKRKNADVDTKASKGRKIRYNVHPKLQNFMFPSNTSKRSDTMDEQLLKSLFQ